MRGLGVPVRDGEGEALRVWGPPGSEWETPEEDGEEPQVGFQGSYRVQEEKEGKRAIKRERRPAAAGERERGEQTQVH